MDKINIQILEISIYFGKDDAIIWLTGLNHEEIKELSDEEYEKLF
jgi:hypothetical protein